MNLSSASGFTSSLYTISGSIIVCAAPVSTTTFCTYTFFHYVEYSVQHEILLFLKEHYPKHNFAHTEGFKYCNLLNF